MKMNEISGPAVIVETDGSKFGKRKCNRCREKVASFVVVIDRRKKLLKIVRRIVLFRLIIMSNCWKMYICLLDQGFIYLSVNHSMTFKYSLSEAHTNSIEGM